MRLGGWAVRSRGRSGRGRSGRGKSGVPVVRLVLEADE